MTISRLPLIETGTQFEGVADVGIVIPASFFGIILGLVGLGNVWRAANNLWNLPGWIGETIMLLAFIVWTCLLLLYLSKWIWHRKESIEEVEDPVQCCFIGLVPVSTLLVALAVLPYSRPAAVSLFMIGAFGTVTFSVWRHGGLWRGGREPAATTPVLYLPTVAGNFVIAIVAGALGWTGWGQLFFGAGFFAWIALESVILYRFLVIDPLKVPLRPTLGIQLAPPAVGLVAYLSVTEGEPGLFAQMIFGYVLLQCLILLRLLPWIRKPADGAGARWSSCYTLPRRR